MERREGSVANREMAAIRSKDVKVWGCEALL